MMWLLGSIIIGLLAGAIAGRIVEGRGFGCLGNIIIGVIGAVIGGFLCNQLGLGPGEGFLGELIVATVGAVVLLLVVNLITGK